MTHLQTYGVIRVRATTSAGSRTTEWRKRTSQAAASLWYRTPRHLFLTQICAASRTRLAGLSDKPRRDRWRPQRIRLGGQSCRVTAKPTAIFPDNHGCHDQRTGRGTLAIASAGKEQQADQIIALREKTDKNVAYMWTGSRDNNRVSPSSRPQAFPVYTPDSLARGLRICSITMHGMRSAWQVFCQCARHHSRTKRNARELQSLKRNALSESESKQLSQRGRADINEVCAKDADGAVKAAEKIIILLF